MPVGGLNAGSAYISVKPDMRGFNRGVEQQVGGFGKKAGILLGVATAGAAAVGFAAKAVKLEAEFSKTMNKFQAASGATSREMRGMQSLALKMGADTVFSANEASEAMLALAKSGMKPAAIEAGALQQALALAAADGLSMERAAEVMGNTLNTFNLKAKESAQVSNALAGAANASSASVDSIAQGLAQVGAVAADSSQTVQQTTAAIAALADAGIQGSDAGTSLKTMLTRLQPSTKAAREAFESFGLASYQSSNSMKELQEMGIKPASSSLGDVTSAIEQYLIRTGAAGEGTMKLTEETNKLLWSTGMVENAFVKSNGEFKSITQIAGVLEDKFGDLSASERAAALETLFGADARRAATILTKEGAEGLARYVKETSNQTAAEKMAAAGMKGTAGALEQLSGSLETVMLQFGIWLRPAINRGLNMLTAAVNGIVPAMSAVGGWVRRNSTLLKVLGSIVLAGLAAWAAYRVTVMATTVAMKVMTVWTKRQIIVQRLLNRALLMNPIGLVVAALAALAVGLVIAYKKSETFRKIVDGAWKAIRVAIKFAWDRVIKPVFKAWKDYLTNVLFPVVRFLWNNVIKPLWKKIGDAIKWAWDRVIKPAFNALRTGIGRVRSGFETGVNAIKRAWDKIRDAVRKPINAVINIVNNGIIDKFNAVSSKLGGPKIPRLKGFADGGWTGPGGKYQPAGIVHGDEFVIRKESRQKIERRAPGLLDRMNRQGDAALHSPHRRPPGFFRGGRVPMAGTTSVSRHSGYPWARWAGDLNGSGDDTGKAAQSWREGTVAFRGWGGADSYGNYMRVNHPGNVRTLYAHLNSFVAQVGQKVRAGQTIGRVGSTGKSSGPHLHFELAGGSNPLGAATVGSSAAPAAPSFLSTLGKAVGAFVKNPLDMLKGAIKGPLNGLLDRFGNSPMAKLAAGVPRTLMGAAADKIKSLFGIAEKKYESRAGAVIGKAGSIVSAGTARATAKASLSKWGWGPNQWPPLDNLVMRESSWNPNAANPTSSARGLFQKMTSLHGPIEKTIAGQIKWGFNYIKGRYGSPANAWSHWQRNGNYDRGGIAYGKGLLAKDTIRPERVLDPRTTANFERFTAALDTSVRRSRVEPGPVAASRRADLRPIVVEDRSGNPRVTAQETARRMAWEGIA